MTNEEYQKKFLAIFPSAEEEEFEEFKRDYQKLEEKYQNFSKSVSEKCADRLVELNKQYIEGLKENYSNFFFENWIFINFMMNK